MSEHVTEKVIRARLSDGQLRFGDNSIRCLLSVIDDLRGELEMWKANADEAALKAARREARISELIQANLSCAGESKVDLFSDLARENAFEELKRRDEELQSIKGSVDKSRGAWLPHMALFCLSVVKGEDVGLRFGHTAAALHAEWRRMAEKIEALEKEVKCCRKGEQE